jgi:hypothetical protein
MYALLRRVAPMVRPMLFGLSLTVLVGLGLLMLAGKSQHMQQTENNTADYWALSQQVSVSNRDAEEPVENSGANEKQLFTEFTRGDIAVGQVVWQTPEKLGDLGWADEDVYDGSYASDMGRSYGVKYLKVGTVKEGKYAQFDIILVATHLVYDGPSSPAPALSHYLRRGDEVVYLPYADVANGDEKRPITSDSFGDGKIRSKFDISAPNQKIDTETRIVELASYPEEFTGRSDREVFVKNTYAGPAFFSRERLKYVLTHPTLGEVWMADSLSKNASSFELNSYLGVRTDTTGKTSKSVRVKQYYDPVANGGFYLKRPDGVTVSYRLKFDIFDEFNREGVLQATWNDGTRNEDGYEEYPSGCGLSAYVYDVTNDINMNKELVKIGATLQGDALYGYKDTKSKAFQEMYGYFKNGYSLLQTKDLTEKQFLDMRPAVFWIDPFGRLLKFQNAQLVPLAECGKPVVYLYPQETIPVSVQVFPNEGVSVSEPAYNDGWKVMATPDGKLINVTDGKPYPYLFWEGGSSVLYQPSDQGFVVGQDELGQFFDDKLALLGLVGREIDDFKEFWIPKMQELHKPYYFVTFLPRQQIDAMAPLDIVPKPDTTIRVMMDYEGRDTDEAVNGYPIHTPERHGFTAVEWGGRLKW